MPDEQFMDEIYESDGDQAEEQLRDALANEKISMKEALEILKSDVCACKNLKQRMQVFCRPCYNKLPYDLKGNLYKKIGAGFEEAVAKANGCLGFNNNEERVRNV